jgi:septal ring factor EnvC (AmiA/AmiB activator)
MANTNLAQHEQILKSLEQSLKEIGDQHKMVYESLAKLHTSSRQAWDDVNAAWSKIVKLFVTIEELRSTRLKFEQEEQ